MRKPIVKERSSKTPREKTARDEGSRTPPPPLFTSLKPSKVSRKRPLPGPLDSIHGPNLKKVLTPRSQFGSHQAVTGSVDDVLQSSWRHESLQSREGGSRSSAGRRKSEHARTGSAPSENGSRPLMSPEFTPGGRAAPKLIRHLLQDGQRAVLHTPDERVEMLKAKLVETRAAAAELEDVLMRNVTVKGLINVPLGPSKPPLEFGLPVVPDDFKRWGAATPLSYGSESAWGPAISAEPLEAEQWPVLYDVRPEERRTDTYHPLAVHSLPEFVPHVINSMVQYCTDDGPSSQHLRLDSQAETIVGARAVCSALQRFNACHFQAAVASAIFGRHKGARGRMGRAAVAAAAAKGGKHLKLEVDSLAVLGGSAGVGGGVPATATAEDARFALERGELLHVFTKEETQEILYRCRTLQVDQDGNAAQPGTSVGMPDIVTEAFLRIATARFRVYCAALFHCRAVITAQDKAAAMAAAVQQVPRLPPLKLNVGASMVKAVEKEESWGPRSTPRILCVGYKGDASLLQLRKELEKARELTVRNELAIRFKSKAWAGELTHKGDDTSDCASVVEKVLPHILRILDGADKLAEWAERSRKRAIHKAWGRWRRYKEFQKSLEVAHTLVHAVGARSMILGIIAPIQRRRMLRWLKQWATVVGEERLLEVNAAAAQIQRVYRGHAATVLAYRMHLDNCATAIQRFARGMIARRKVKAKRLARRRIVAVKALTIWLRGRIRRRRIIRQKRVWQEVAAAVKVQSSWRMVVRGKRVAQATRAKLRQDLAARAITRAIRISAIVGKRRRKRRQNTAAKIIQAIARGHQARRLTAKIRLREMSACTIQRAHRCATARKRVRRMKAEVMAREKAVGTLQFVFRRRQAQKANTLMRAAVVLQKCCKKAVKISKDRAAKKLLDERRRYQGAAGFQRMWRGVLGRRDADAMRIRRMARRDSAIKLQAVVRGRQARQRARGEFVDAMRRLRTQLSLRGVDDDDVEVLSVALGPLMDSMSVRNTYESLQVDTASALGDVESDGDKETPFMLSPAAARYGLYYRLKLQYLTAQEVAHGKSVRRLQALVRGFLTRRRLKNPVTDEESLDTVSTGSPSIASVRGMKSPLASARGPSSQSASVASEETLPTEESLEAEEEPVEVLQQRNELYNTIAIILQSQWRAKLARLRVKQLHHERRLALEARHAAATMIQAAERGRICRAHWGRRIKSRREAALDSRRYASLQLQKWWRGTSARIEAGKRRAEVAEAARLAELDRLLRKMVLAEHMGERVNHYVLRIQSWFRMALAVIIVDEIRHAKAEEQAKAVAIAAATDAAVKRIQRWARGCLGREKYRNIYAKLYADREKRRYCEECEAMYAVRSCHECHDRFCMDCWTRLHTKGHRRFHGWKNIDTGILPTIRDPNTAQYYGYFPQFDQTTGAAVSGYQQYDGASTYYDPASQGGYYDSYGQWISYTPTVETPATGYYDANGNWVWSSADTTAGQYGAASIASYDVTGGYDANTYSYDVAGAGYNANAYDYTQPASNTYSYDNNSYNSSTGAAASLDGYSWNESGQRIWGDGDWTEYFDDNAQASYWYQHSTGTASWTGPG